MKVKDTRPSGQLHRALGPANGYPNGSSTAKRTVTVGVVETVPLYRDGLTALIERTPWAKVAAHSASQQGALLMNEQLTPDIVLLDSGLAPNAHLVELLTAHKLHARVVVLVRDADRNPRYLASCMRAGAHGAVPRTAEPQRVLEAVRQAARAHRYLDPALASLVTHPEAQPPAQRRAGDGEAPPPRVPLSRREYQVMQLIAEGQENAAIAKELFLSVETVRTHVKSILRKLSARDRTHAVSIAFRTGMLSISPDAARDDDLAAPTTPTRPVRR
ncbi:response regulator transcription factor [Thermocrispum sp.]|uniref:Response regulator transcription factor n=1 Tax=Thermocrispum agreste TaxID=37925 RepID=A0ABD6FIL0_9PSEU|nr:response regulator transcription factor [Thermocrispum sp.]